MVAVSVIYLSGNLKSPCPGQLITALILLYFPIERLLLEIENVFRTRIKYFALIYCFGGSRECYVLYLVSGQLVDKMGSRVAP